MEGINVIDNKIKNNKKFKNFIADVLINPEFYRDRGYEEEVSIINLLNNKIDFVFAKGNISNFKLQTETKNIQLYELFSEIYLDLRQDIKLDYDGKYSNKYIKGFYFPDNERQKIYLNINICIDNNKGMREFFTKELVSKKENLIKMYKEKEIMMQVKTVQIAKEFNFNQEETRKLVNAISECVIDEKEIEKIVKKAQAKEIKFPKNYISKVLDTRLKMNEGTKKIEAENEKE